MKRIVITGPSGFLGRNTLPQLVKRGYEVHALDRSSLEDSVDPYLHKHITFHQVDLLDDSATGSLMKAIQPQYLMHYAWYVTPGLFWHAIENLHWVAASLRLFDHFRINGGRRAVFAGTCAEYDWDFDPLSEATTPLTPGTLYGVAKNEMRIIMEKAAEQSDLSIAWGRIFFLYGPHEQKGRLVPDIINNLLNEQPAKCSHGRQLRDFMHAADVARAFIEVMESEWTGAVNIASGKTVSIADVVNTIGEITGRSDLLRIGAIPASPSDPASLAADTNILNKTIGFQPEFNLSEGLANTIEWWQNKL